MDYLVCRQQVKVVYSVPPGVGGPDVLAPEVFLFGVEALVLSSRSLILTARADLVLTTGSFRDPSLDEAVRIKDLEDSTKVECLNSKQEYF